MPIKGESTPQSTKIKLSLALRGRKGGMLGKRHTKETKERMRASALARPPISEETHQKLIEAAVPRRGIPISEATIKKRCVTLNLKNSNLPSHVKFNEAHPFYADNRIGYNKLKQTVYKRDQYTCVRCHRKLEELKLLGASTVYGYHLIAHHVIPIYVGKYNKLCDSLSNMISLCQQCHGNVHGNQHDKENGEDKWRNFLPAARCYLSRFGYKKLLADSIWAK